MSSPMRAVLALPLAVVLLALFAPATAAEPAEIPTVVSVELDRTQADAGAGEKIAFVSTLRNTGGQPVSDLIAHLNILTSDPDVYVDPEDWSPRRTQYVDELAPGETVELSWEVQAVTSGPIILYVAASYRDAGKVAASGPLHMTVFGRRVVNADRVLPLVLGVPGSVLALAALTVLRRRRLG